MFSFKRILMLLSAAVLGIAVVGMVGAVVSASFKRDSADDGDGKIASSYLKPKPAVRPTMDLTTEELIATYNSFSGQMDRKLKLPPLPSINESARNDDFHVLTHKADENLYLTLEIDNRTARPFSLGFTGSGGPPEASIRMLYAITSISATIFGKGDNAGSLGRVCTSAAKRQSMHAEERIAGFSVYCTVIEGVWMGGISVPKSPD